MVSSRKSSLLPVSLSFTVERVELPLPQTFSPGQPAGRIPFIPDQADTAPAKVDGLVKSAMARFRSWFYTSPRTENQTFRVVSKRSS
jgi:hypothetical protein